jgi:hypothetical protein
MSEFIEEFQRKECTEFDQTYPDIIKAWWGIPKNLELIPMAFMPQHR